MVDMMHQAIGHAFVNNANIMTNSFQNAMVQGLKERVALTFAGPCYHQPITSFPNQAPRHKRMGAQSVAQPTEQYHFKLYLHQRKMDQHLSF